jgi:hypothetical protein
MPTLFCSLPGIMGDGSTIYNEGLNRIWSRSDELIESYDISDQDPQRVNINFLCDVAWLSHLGWLSANSWPFRNFVGLFCSPDSGDSPVTIPATEESKSSPLCHHERAAAFSSRSP